MTELETLKFEETSTETTGGGSYISSALTLTLNPVLAYCLVCTMNTVNNTNANAKSEFRWNVTGVGITAGVRFHVAANRDMFWTLPHAIASGGTDVTIEWRNLTQNNSSIYGVTDKFSNITAIGMKGFGFPGTLDNESKVTGSNDTTSSAVFVDTSLAATLQNSQGGKYMAYFENLTDTTTASNVVFRFDLGGTPLNGVTEEHTTTHRASSMVHVGDLNGDEIKVQWKTSAGTVTLFIGTALNLTEIRS